MRSSALLSVILIHLLLAAPAMAQGKTYVIKGMGKHYTRTGKELRRSAPHQRLPLVPLKAGPGFVAASAERAWGTQLTVETLRAVLADFAREYPKQLVIVGDLSKKGGGVLDNHNSHLDGRDVDIHLPLEPLEEITDRRPRTPNAGQTWFLIKALADSCAIEHIFVDREVQRLVHRWAVNEGFSPKELQLILQYPQPERRAVGIVRHWTNHRDHLHVRFLRAAGTLDGAVKAYCDFRKSRAIE